MSGIMSSLIAGDNVCLFRKNVNNLPLTFVTPLGSGYHYYWHLLCSLSAKRALKARADFDSCPEFPILKINLPGRKYIGHRPYFGKLLFVQGSVNAYYTYRKSPGTLSPKVHPGDIDVPVAQERSD